MDHPAVFWVWLAVSIVIYLRGAWREIALYEEPYIWLYSIPVFVALMVGAWYFMWGGKSIPWVWLAITVIFQRAFVDLFIRGLYLAVTSGSAKRAFGGSQGFPEAIFAWSAMVWIRTCSAEISATALIVLSLMWLYPLVGVLKALYDVGYHSNDEFKYNEPFMIIDIITTAATLLGPLILLSVFADAPIALRIGLPLAVGLLYVILPVWLMMTLATQTWIWKKIYHLTP
jgi:hypothetical protein